MSLFYDSGQTINETKVKDILDELVSSNDEDNYQRKKWALLEIMKVFYPPEEKNQTHG